MLADRYLVLSTEYEYIHATFIDVRVKTVRKKVYFCLIRIGFS